MILSRRGASIETTKQLFTVADLQVVPETTKTPAHTDEEKNNDGLFGGLFDYEEEKTKKPLKQK